MGRRTLVALGLLGSVLLTGCAGSGSGDGEASAGSAVVTAGQPGTNADPNAAGRSAAAATATADTSSAVAVPGGSSAICANETLEESMTRAVQAGSSVLLATGGFTGTTMLADGEIGVPYSEVRLTVEQRFGGPEVPQSLSAWVYGDLAAANGSASTGEASSLWARGGRMVAVIDTATQWSGLPGPVLRAAPVIGDEVIMSWVGCWSTNGVTSREFDGSVDIFDERGLHPAQLQLFAVSLAEFAGLFAD